MRRQDHDALRRRALLNSVILVAGTLIFAFAAMWLNLPNH
jgi:hypothetical protein